MYKRIAILSAIIVMALCGLTLLGYHSVRLWAKGEEGTRLGEFAAVAEQIRQDVKHKLEKFIEQEQKRPYTDYQYYYVPESAAANTQQQTVLLRSPLGESIENGLAYGSFQIEPDWKIITPYYRDDQARTEDVKSYLSNVQSNVLPALKGKSDLMRAGERLGAAEPVRTIIDKSGAVNGTETLLKAVPAASKTTSRSQRYPIESLQEAPRQTQVLQQQRGVAMSNVAQNAQSTRGQADALYMAKEAEKPASVTGMADTAKELKQANQPADKVLADNEPKKEKAADLLETAPVEQIDADVNKNKDADKVQIRIEPFVPMVVGGGDSQNSIFGGQVFLLRHVQIENRHFVQGFKLNEKRLLDEVGDSAQRFMRKGMHYELSPTENPKAAYSAILDFGFGNLILNMMETDPGWIDRQIRQIQVWYFSIVSVVAAAATLGLVSLWRNVREQVKLAQKKDDFISAVSHELRTPLTSIRMYSEMLDKDWVKSPDKQKEYFASMHQESERLSRLIDNVLDFSRIQKGRKTYNFRMGQINKCVEGVVEMMRPYAAQNGFKIVLECQATAETSFDSDTLTQIVVNLIDNAVKYARDAEDKTIYVRTQKRDNYVLIEVEDHGPGIPHQQRKKVFEEFYRTEAENTRQTQGMGLGLALVKRFAEAHNGFVEILSAKPSGSVFRVALPTQI